MGTSRETIAFIMAEVGAELGCKTRAMFGEYALYFDDKVVGLICDDQLFIKQTKAETELFLSLARGEPYPGAKPQMMVSQLLMDDPGMVAKLIVSTAACLPRPKPKVPRKPTKLRQLRGLGPKSESQLLAAGIDSISRLQALGATAAYRIVERHFVKGVSLNLLYALEGALTDRDWRDVVREDKHRLLTQLDALREKESLGGTSD